MSDKMSVEQAVATLSKLAIFYGNRRHRAAAETLRAELDGLRAKSSRAYVAEQMRGLVPEHKALPDVYLASYHEARGHNACRAETLANIDRWERGE